MKFYAFHGVLPQERYVGNHFSVDVSIAVPLENALRTDDLNDTINYTTVYSLIKKEMDIPSCLIEHVAGRILCSLKKHFPGITETELSLSKLNPPIAGADVHSAAIFLKESY
jgi:dihydroneopterin aldolase